MENTGVKQGWYTTLDGNGGRNDGRWIILNCKEATAVAIPLEPLAQRKLATLSQRCLLHTESSYLLWKATACLKALQTDENESPLMEILGNSETNVHRSYVFFPHPLPHLRPVSSE